MANEKVRFREPVPGEDEEHAYEEDRTKVVVIVRRGLSRHLAETGFLSKYKVETIVEAVRKSNAAAREFMELALKHKGLATQDLDKLCEAILGAIEKDHGAAQGFMSNPEAFLQMMGPKKMREALYAAIFRYDSCRDYFLGHYKARFFGMKVAQEVYLKIGPFDQPVSRLAN
ncbi:hypothetical protein HZA44_01665 [Candidatus Peregrinibacteria bacterium]|nr:hypothetical protein [Candidatus Peregrinibacteria bacterium]